MTWLIHWGWLNTSSGYSRRVSLLWELDESSEDQWTYPPSRVLQDTVLSSADAVSQANILRNYFGRTTYGLVSQIDQWESRWIIHHWIELVEFYKTQLFLEWTQSARRISGTITSSGPLIGQFPIISQWESGWIIHHWIELVDFYNTQLFLE